MTTTIALAASCAILSIILFFPFTADDAYIVARYAARFERNGLPLSFNDGEWINALTSTTQAHLMAAFVWMGLNPILAWKIFGGTALLATACIVGLSFRHLRTPFLGGLLIFLASPVVFWSFGGLETPLAMLLATLISFLFVFHRAEWLIMPLALLLFFTRFDSVLFSAPIALWLVIESNQRRAQLLIGTMCAAIGLTLLCGLHNAYGSILPTSFFVKTPDFSVWNALKNGTYIFLNLILIFAPITLALAYNRQTHVVISARWLVAIFSLILIILYGLSAATTHMMFNFRLLAPYVPVAYVLIAHAISLQVNPDKSNGSFAQALALSVAVSASFASINATKIYFDSLEGIIPMNEGKYSSIRYNSIMLSTLERQADDIRAHAAQSELSRAPVLNTPMGGALPNALQEFKIIETLVSYRADQTCYKGPRDLRSSSNYIHILDPIHGSVELQMKDIKNYEIISDVRFLMAQLSVRSIVAYNPKPLPLNLPARSFDPCLR